MSSPSEGTQSDVAIADSHSGSYNRDNEFFIDIKPLYLCAETTLFCVPHHYFQTSDVFAQTLGSPVLENAPQEGSSEEHPLVLENVTADEFREFLRVLSSRFTTNNNTTKRSNAESWLIALKLASLWKFRGLKEEALEHLKSEDCVIRIQVARQYNVEDWFLPALMDLVARPKPLTGDEISQLGVDFAAKAIAVREEVRKSSKRYSDRLKVITDKFGGNTSASA